MGGGENGTTPFEVQCYPELPNLYIVVCTLVRREVISEVINRGKSNKRELPKEVYCMEA